MVDEQEQIKNPLLDELYQKKEESKQLNMPQNNSFVEEIDEESNLIM